MPTPLLSVVVPTRNRRHLIARLIGGLERQVDPLLPFELIVVDDGSADGTVDALRSLTPAFELRVIERHAGGPAAARNAGAAHARGEILIFLDDDMEPLPGAFAAHARLHAPGTRYLGLGDIPPVAADGSFLATIVRGWWLDMRPGIGQPGYRYRIRDVLTGHVSIRREHFDALGGFDLELWCHEDWEFGHRALQMNLELRFLPDAVAIHHDENAFNLEKVVRRKFDEGIADVQLARTHPELVLGLPLAWESAGRRNRLLRALAFRAPRLGEAAARALLYRMRMYELANLRFRWRIRIEAVLGYWYWRGVASVVNEAGLRDIVASGAVDVRPIAIDVAAGIDAAARQLDRLRPASVVLLYGPDTLQSIPPMPGHEPLAGRHLKVILARWCDKPLARALARAGKAPPILLGALERDRDREPKPSVAEPDEVADAESTDVQTGVGVSTVS